MARPVAPARPDRCRPIARRWRHLAVAGLAICPMLAVAQAPAPATAAAGCAAVEAAQTGPVPASQVLQTITDGYAVRTGAAPNASMRWRVAFQAGVEWPHVILRPVREPWNVAAHGALLLPLTNAGPQEVDVHLRVGDDEAATWPAHAGATRIRLAPFERRHVLLPLCAVDARSMGMRAGPPPRLRAPLPPTQSRGLVALPLDGRADPRRISSVYLVVDGRAGAHQLLIGDLQAVPVAAGASAYDGLFDRFGQTTVGQWPEKIGDENDLQRRAAAEQARLDGLPELASDAWRFGPPPPAGVTVPRFAPSGFFRTQRADDGRWWLVTPEGQGFFSVGVDTVTQQDMATYVQGRERMFVDLPPPDGPLAAHYGEADLRRDMGAQAGQGFNHGRYLNFYTANLQRRYGEDFQAAWRQVTLRRLRDWGFNTLGNWSHPDLYAPGQAERLPYTVPLSIEGDFARVSDGVDYWGKMPDPFDPRFAQAVDRLMAQQAAPRRDDPMLLGYFVDNELAWGNGRAPSLSQRYALAFNALKGPADSPAKQAFLGALRERHASPAAWAQAWGIAVGGDRAWPADWDAAARQPIALPDTLGEAAVAELSAFSRRFADAYFRTVADALKRHAPNHLYLGARFAAQTDEAVGACDRYCDVVSFNIYHATFTPARQDRFRELTKPALVGEFNFSSTDRGPFWPGLVDVGSEAARGRAYADYVREAAADPQMVGVHWFQYVDQPASGRILDGENAHFGLVSITDVPFDGFTQAVREANRGVWRARVGAAR